MIEFIIGKLISIEEDHILLQNNNIGYKIYTSNTSKHNLKIGMDDVLIYTNLIVREDSITLYGFTSKSELEIFNLLLLVSRIGPKVALGILSTLTPNEIKKAILTKDINSLCKAQGVGKKTGERIILELRDRIDEDVYIDDLKDDNNESIINKREAINALTGLGYTNFEIEKTLTNINLDKLSVEEIIRLTLKELSR